MGMKRAFQSVALLLTSVLLFGPLAQAHASCRTLRSTGHCSNCPVMRQAPDCSNILTETANRSCCRISAARPSANVAWQPVMTYALAPPPATAMGSPLLFSPLAHRAAGADDGPAIPSAQSLLCTFLI